MVTVGAWNDTRARGLSWLQWGRWRHPRVRTAAGAQPQHRASGAPLSASSLRGGQGGPGVGSPRALGAV